jgi:hypothetical protein
MWSGWIAGGISYEPILEASLDKGDAVRDVSITSDFRS